MRVNLYVASATGLSRRAADRAVLADRVSINGVTVRTGQQVQRSDEVRLDGLSINLPMQTTTVVFNKPVGYVCSRNGQGNKTVYSLLPQTMRSLKPVGRLDKDSSGLLLLTNNGKLAHKLTHPSFDKDKIYQVVIDKPLTPPDQAKIVNGVDLDDRPSKLQLRGEGKRWTITMHEGRNRQIRRTFTVLGYQIITLHRTNFGQYSLGELRSGKYRQI